MKDTGECMKDKADPMKNEIWLQVRELEQIIDSITARLRKLQFRVGGGRFDISGWADSQWKERRQVWEKVQVGY